MVKKKPDMFERKLKALVKLRMTKSGRAIFDEHKSVFRDALCDAIGKP